MKTELVWEQLFEKGLEHLVLRQYDKIEADGVAVGIVNDAPYRIQYQIICDLDWNVQTLKILDLLDGKSINLVRAGAEWSDGNGDSIEAFRGCVDVDIMVTPFTNTLPIRRLNLLPGESKEISVVYIRVPDLNLSRLDQRYSCLSQDQDGGIYKYESLNGGFTADLKVDQAGLVVDYPGIFKLAWKRNEAD